MENISIKYTFLKLGMYNMAFYYENKTEVYLDSIPQYFQAKVYGQDMNSIQSDVWAVISLTISLMFSTSQHMSFPLFGPSTETLHN